ncbi:MAG TPA: PKD domain-containing protein [Candidatus Paceibacterota bacterium]
MMHAFAAKFGALALAPMMFFGAHMGLAAHHGTVPYAAASTTSKHQAAALSIKDIDGPTALTPGAEGTWTVDTKTASDGTLHYSVKWGDEGASPLMALLRSPERTQTSATFTHTYDADGTYTPVFTVSDDNGNTVTKKGSAVTVSDETAARVTDIDPSSGPVGTDVTLTGTGFTDDSIVRFGTGAIKDATVSDDGTSLTFTVPSDMGAYCKPGAMCPMYAILVRPGTYDVRVQNGSTTSNAVEFKVTAAASTGRISVSGIDAPTTLAVGEEGTWTLHAATNASGNLHYSVVWGDESASPLRAMALSSTEQSSATFTHVYDTKGTYAPKFTVSDDNGHSASVSASVVVKAK